MRPERIVDVVLEVCEPPSRSRPAIAASASLLLLGALAFGMSRVTMEHAAPPIAPKAALLVEVEVRPSPRGPPLPRPPTTAPPPPVQARRPAPSGTARPAQQLAAPPAPVVTAASEGPVDLTDEVIIVGEGREWLGGVTSVDGTATTVGTGADTEVPAPPALDSSRPVGLVVPEWGCPWPNERAGDGLHEATAVVQVTVRADGTAEDALVLEDPGLGFGEAARRCALRSTFEPALDRDGNPILARSAPIRVRFWR